MSGSRPRGTALRAWSGTFGTNILLLVIGISTGIISARLLGPEGRGQLAEVLFWGAFVAQLAGLGLAPAVTIEAARSERHDPLIVTATFLALAYGLTAAALFALLSPLFVSGALEGLIVAYTLAFLPVTLLGGALTAIDQGRQRFGIYNTLRVIPQGTYLVLMLGLLLAGTYGVAAFVWASFAGTALVAVARLVSMSGAFRVRPQIDLARRLFVSGFQLHTQALVGIFQNTGDRLLIIAFLDDAALGLYAVALTLAGAGINKVSGATTIILLPKVASGEDDDVRGRQLSTALGATLFVALVLNGALAAASPVLVPLLFGEAFAPAVGVTILLCLAQVLKNIIQVLATGLRGYGDWRSGLIAMSINLVVFALVALVSTAPLGILGVGLGLVAGNTVGAAFILFRAVRRTGLPPGHFLVPPGWMFSPSTLRARLARRGAV